MMYVEPEVVVPEPELSGDGEMLPSVKHRNVIGNNDSYPSNGTEPEVVVSEPEVSVSEPGVVVVVPEPEVSGNMEMLPSVVKHRNVINCD